MLTKVSIVAAVAATLMMLTPAFLKASARAVAEGVVVAGGRRGGDAWGRWRWWRPAGKVVVGAGILIATSRVVVAGQSLGGDTTAVFGTGLVDGVSGAGMAVVADWLRGLRLRRRGREFSASRCTPGGPCGRDGGGFLALGDRLWLRRAPAKSPAEAGLSR